MLDLANVAELVVDYSESSFGSPPFRNVTHWEFTGPEADGPAALGDLVGGFADVWQDVMEFVAPTVSGVTATARLLYSGVIFTSQSALPDGGDAGSGGAGGASCRITLATLHAPGERNGALYLPGVSSDRYGDNTGVLTAGYITDLSAAITPLLSGLPSGSESWLWSVPSSDGEDPPTYTPRRVGGISIKPTVTFYDTRY